MTLRLSVPTAVLLAVSVAAAAVAGSAAPDHLQCYAVRDPLPLRALVDLTSPQYGLAKGCRVRRGRELCVPASKAVTSAENTSTRPPTPITPLPVPGNPAAGDYVCYRVSCPDETLPKEQPITDQFGGRKLGRLKTTKLCTPAVETTTTTTSSCPGYTTTTVLPCGLFGCLGFCPTAVQCVPSAQNPNVCACEGPPAPCGLTGPSPGGSTCGGTCAQGTTCQVVDTDPIPGCFGYLTCGCK